jgi:hypothetical protein
MKTSGLHVCLAAASLYDPELLATYAALLIVLVCGVVAVYAAFRWYRGLKQLTSTRSEDLAQLAQALEEQDGLNPDELQRVRAALERQKSSEPGTPNPGDARPRLP